MRFEILEVSSDTLQIPGSLPGDRRGAFELVAHATGIPFDGSYVYSSHETKAEALADAASFRRLAVQKEIQARQELVALPREIRALAVLLRVDDRRSA